MASFVNAADIISAAVEIECRGHAFYVRAANEAQEQEDKDFFTFMAKEEQRHEKIFQAMLQRVGGLSLPAGSTEPEYLEYVDLLLNSHSLFMAEQQELLQQHPLMQAMYFEKDTILFFTAMRRMVPEAEAVHIEACIEEEQKHLRLLAEHDKARRMAQKRT